MDNKKEQRKAVGLCDDLINDCYEGRVSSPVELSSRVRRIKEAFTEELDHFREAAKMVGDVSAMREALVSLLDSVCDDCQVPSDMTESGLWCGWRGRWDGCPLKAEIDNSTAALAALPRNCDRFQTVEDAKTAWHNYKVSCPTPPGGWGDGDLLDWFLAKAEGAEG